MLNLLPCKQLTLINGNEHFIIYVLIETILNCAPINQLIKLNRCSFAEWSFDFYHCIFV